MTDPGTTRGYRFGRFYFDVSGWGLFEEGRRVDIQDLPMRLLLALLERPGEVVARRELYERLWPDRFVDAERGLNTVVRKLRRALGDHAGSPRFIETLPRRGYRLAVTVAAAAAAPPPAADTVAAPPPAAHTVALAPAAWISLASLASILLAAGILLFATGAGAPAGGSCDESGPVRAASGDGCPYEADAEPGRVADRAPASLSP